MDKKFEAFYAAGGITSHHKYYTLNQRFLMLWKCDHSNAKLGTCIINNQLVVDPNTFAYCGTKALSKTNTSYGK